MKNCKFCNKECISDNSLTQHSIRCRLNPNAIKVVPTAGNTGKRHSDATKKLMREKTLQQHAAGKCTYRSKGNGTFNGKKHDADTITKISNSMKGNRNANHRGDRQSYYKDIRMDSSWEVKTAEYFDKNGIIWKYSERGFKLSDGRVYYPDFFIYENSQFTNLVEVKGYFREANRLKFEMFLREYPEVKIELWQKQELKDRKILE
jgi:hypothetical protein